MPRAERLAAAAAFERAFGRPPDGVTEAPGRVNLIGEHVDYNDGLVLPFAIDRSVLCAWSRREESEIRAYFMDYDASSRFDVSSHPGATASSRAPLSTEWRGVGGGASTSYIHAVVLALRDAGHVLGGIDFAITGDVPIGAGLSSSAALEVAVAGAIRSAFELPISDVDLALLCQRAENEYVGVQSGIMDQFASALSKRGHALLIDCRTLAYRHVPLRLAEAGLAIVIADSGVRRDLVSSAYNDRRDECEAAVAELRGLLARPDLASLRDVTAADLDAVIGDAPGVPLRRARHVVSEIARVAAAVDALAGDDFAALGRLMDESHQSLRQDYDVSSRELDLLAGLASAQDYVLGARLTGAGFGGCTVNLVRADALDAFERDVISPYRAATGHTAAMYVTSPEDGLRVWWPPKASNLPTD